MAKISEATIARVNEQVSIVDLAESLGVSLKRSSSGAMAKCFVNSTAHKAEDKTPSLGFKEPDNYCNCFGCGYSARPIKLYMDMTNSDFPTAVKELAGRSGIEIEYEGGARPVKNDNRRFHSVIAAAQNYYVSQLQNNEKALNYLKGRGFSDSSIKKIGFGYIPNDYGRGLIHSLKRAGIDQDDAIKAGVLKYNGNGKLMPTINGMGEGRVSLPVTNDQGKPVGFGARVLDDSKPKYLNSPDSEVFKKNQILYNLYDARREIASAGRKGLVVEGYMDVLSLREQGINNAVASMGTAISSNNIQKLSKYADEVVFCFDGDPAGFVAAQRALERALPVADGATKLRFALLPEGHDPDSFVKEYGVEAFNEAIDGAHSLTEFFVRSISHGKGDEPEDAFAKIEQAGKLLSTMREGIFQTLLVKAVSKDIGIDSAEISKHIGITNAAKVIETPGLADVDPDRRRVDLNPDRSNIVPAMESTGEYVATHAERVVKPGKNTPVRNSTPEALFMNTHRQAGIDLITADSITRNSFIKFIKQTCAYQSRISYGELDPDGFIDTINNVFTRYIRPAMEKKGHTAEEIIHVKETTSMNTLPGYVQGVNTHIKSEYIANDVHADDVLMIKPGGKRASDIPQLASAATNSPGR